MISVALGPGVPRRGGSIGRFLGQSSLRLLGGWSVTGELPDCKKMVCIAAPHTSNWDFVIAISAVLALQLDINFLGKHTVFKGPLGVLMRHLGGIPVDRRVRSSVVEQMVNEFSLREHLLLGLAPEGTRKKVDKWKTGGLQIAHAASVPLILVALDYGKREIQIGPPFATTGDADADMVEIRKHFGQVQARYPEKA